jgi:hypothetical protein
MGRCWCVKCVLPGRVFGVERTSSPENVRDPPMQLVVEHLPEFRNSIHKKRLESLRSRNDGRTFGLASFLDKKRRTAVLGLHSTRQAVLPLDVISVLHCVFL